MSRHENNPLELEGTIDIESTVGDTLDHHLLCTLVTKCNVRLKKTRCYHFIVFQYVRHIIF
jgi:hypothetical protein